MNKRKHLRLAALLAAMVLLLVAVFSTSWVHASFPDDNGGVMASSSEASGEEAGPEAENSETSNEGSEGSEFPASSGSEEDAPGEESSEPEEDPEPEDDSEEDDLAEGELAEDGILEDGSLQLDEATVEVYTFEQLSNAISKDNGFVNIYLGKDITTERGIEVSSAKPSVVIDGQGHTLAQHSSSAASNTIFVPNSNTTTKSVQLRNATVAGNNHYGILAGGEGSALSGLVFTFSNVRYTGPQITHLFYGGVQIFDSTITLQRSTNDPINEVLEANRVTLGGEVNIDCGASGNAAFWLKMASASFTIQPGANVTLNTNNYFLYSDAVANGQITIGAGASFVLNAARGFMENGQTISTLNVENGATLVVNHTDSSSDRRIRITGGLAVESGATFIYSRASASSMAFEFAAGASARFTNPDTVKLYTASRYMMHFYGASTLSITADTVNLWANAGSVNEASAPANVWNKATDGTLAQLTVSYAGGALQGVTSNISLADDPVASMPTTDNFKQVNMALLAFGRHSLYLDPVGSADASVTGGVSSPASLTAGYTSGGAAATASGIGSGGRLSIPLGTPADIGTEVLVTSVFNGLHKNAATIVEEGTTTGTLSFVLVPDEMQFMAEGIPTAPGYIYRLEDNWRLVVRDERRTPGAWQVQASAPVPLTGTLEGSSYTLTDALVFVDPATGVRTPLSAGDLPVFTQATGVQGDTDVGWATESGVLLWVLPEEIQGGVTYRTTIEWTLVDAP